MIETENIIYLQMQKTASTFIENELSKNFKVVKHKKHTTLPATLIKNKKIISSIRNPFSWYLSLWNYRGGIYKRTTQLFLKQGIDDFFEILCHDLCALFSPIKRQFMRNNMKNLYSSKSEKLMFKNWFMKLMILQILN